MAYLVLNEAVARRTNVLCMSLGKKKSRPSLAWVCQPKCFGLIVFMWEVGTRMVKNRCRVLERHPERQTRKIHRARSCKPWHWFLLKGNFHTLCTSSPIDLLQNLPCQAGVNSLTEAEVHSIPLPTSGFPATIEPWRLHFCVWVRVTCLRSLCHHAQLHP